MSGLEVIGLVLGAIPLLISGLEHYAEGVQAIRRMIGYKWELKSLINSLRTEDSIFKNTCETLLDGLAPPLKIESLLKTPGGDEWSAPDLSRKLEKRLGDSYAIFFEDVAAVHESIKTFQERLGLGRNGKAQIYEKDTLRKAWKAGKLVLSKSYYDDLINRIKEHNIALKKLTSQSTHLEKSRRSRRQIRSLGILKRYAVGIHQAVGASFRCVCRDQHRAGLSLDPEEAAEVEAEEDFVQFKVVVSGVSTQIVKSQHWEQLRIQVATVSAPTSLSHPAQAISKNANITVGEIGAPARSMIKKRVGFAIASSAPVIHPSLSANLSTRIISMQMASASALASSSVVQHPDIKASDVLAASEITDLCEKLRALERDVSPSLLGMLSDNGTTRFLVHHWNSAGEDAQPDIQSLHQIFSGKRSAQPQLSRSQKLKLAATLSFAVLSQHRTPWMQSAPTRKDVLFLSGSRGLDSRAFMSTPISGPAPDEQDTTPFFIHNSTLFALGILLIEIIFESPIEDLKTEKDQVAGASPWYTQFAIADRLLKQEKILEEGGPDYESAVQRCVRCNFDPHIRQTDLEDEQFRAEVYDNVVQVLKDVERSFHQVKSR